MEQFIDTVPLISGNNDDEDGRSYTPLQGRCQACESYANNVSYINNYFYTFDNGILYSDGQLAVPLITIMKPVSSIIFRGIIITVIVIIVLLLHYY
jgi:hypothetical protein